MKVVKLQKRYKKHPAVWGVKIKNGIYIKTDRKGNPHILENKMIIVDVKRNIMREATKREMGLFEKLVKEGENE